MNRNHFSEREALKFFAKILGVKGDLYHQDGKNTFSLQAIRELLLHPDKTSKSQETLTFQLGKIFYGDSIFDTSTTEGSNIDSQNLAIQIALKKNLEEFFDYFIQHFLRLVFLLRKQVYIYPEKQKNVFIKRIIKEIYVPQAILILYSENMDISLASTQSDEDSLIDLLKHLPETYLNQYVKIHSQHNTTYLNNQFALSFLPSDSPIRYLEKALKNAHKNEYKFILMCRKMIKTKLDPIIGNCDKYQNFIDSKLNKLSSNKIPSYPTFQNDLKILFQELKGELPTNVKLQPILKECFGIFMCFSILERIKKYLIQNLNYSDIEFEKLVKFANSVLVKSTKPNFGEIELVSQTDKLIFQHYQFILQSGFQEWQDLPQNHLKNLNKYIPNYIERKLSIYGIKLLKVIENTKYTQKYFLTNQNFRNIASINCILNSYPEKISIDTYTNEMLNESQKNLETQYHLRPINVPYQLGEYEYLDFKLLMPTNFNWHTFATEELCIILKSSLQGFKNHNFYTPINEFINCLIYLSKQDIENATTSIAISFNSLKDLSILTIGAYLEYILSFYIGLKAYKDKPNFPLLKKYLIFLNPLNPYNFNNPITPRYIPQITVSQPQEQKKNLDPYNAHYLLYIIGHCNYFCLWKNRFPQAAHNPYEALFKPLKKFIYALMTLPISKINDSTLDSFWNKFVNISIKNLTNRQMSITHLTILDILKESEKHFVLFMDLFLDGVPDTKYIFILLYKYHEYHSIKNFIIKKLSSSKL